jgi:transcriptional regulator with XRE-family HTH domain
MAPISKKAGTSSKRLNRNLVGPTVKKLRTAQTLTREDLAARVQVTGWDITFEVVKRIESGRREVNDIELRHLAIALRVPLTLLLEMS